jgi:hypothetical protein
MSITGPAFETMTAVLKEEMKANNVQGIKMDSVKATTDPKKIDVKMKSEEQVDGDMSAYQEKEETGDVGGSVVGGGGNRGAGEGGSATGGIAAGLSAFLVVGAVFGFMYWKYTHRGSGKYEDQHDEEDQSQGFKTASFYSSDGTHVPRGNMMENPYIVGGGEILSVELTDVVVVGDEANTLPKLHVLLNDLQLRSYLNSFVLYGIHNTEILLNEVKEDDLESMGVR